MFYLLLFKTLESVQLATLKSLNISASISFHYSDLKTIFSLHGKFFCKSGRFEERDTWIFFCTLENLNNTFCWQYEQYILELEAENMNDISPFFSTLPSLRDLVSESFLLILVKVFMLLYVECVYLADMFLKSSGDSFWLSHLRNDLVNFGEATWTSSRGVK